MKRLFRLALCVCICVLTLSTAVKADDSVAYHSYTYLRNGDMVNSPPPFITEENVLLTDKEGVKLNFPTDFMMDDAGNIIVADNGGNRIICFDKSYQEIWRLDTFKDKNGNDITLNRPFSVTKDKKGYYYITDEGISDEKGSSLGNGRIIKLDANRKVEEVFEKPTVKQIADFKYYPQRMAVDDSGRMYVIAKNVNQGFLQLSHTGEFEGFLGAPKVTTNPFQVIMRLFSTKEQIKRMQSFVPTEYIGVDIDGDGFIYATTDSINQDDVGSQIYSQRNTGAVNNSGKAEMIRKLNPSGVDILKRRGGFSPIGDIRLPNMYLPGIPMLSAEVMRGSDAILGPSRFVDIKVIEGGVYFTLDTKRSRIFAYDSNSNLLYTFGSVGERKSSFTDPVAIDYYDGDVFILNAKESSLSVCKKTDYGHNMILATQYQNQGDYKSAELLWQEIKLQNTNSEQVYDALGTLDMNADNYQSAMTNFKLADNRFEYSKAFSLYRSSFVDQYFLHVILAIMLIFAALIVVAKLTKKLAGTEGRVGNTFTKLRFGFYATTHPFDGFYDLKHEKRGSLIMAFVLYALIGISAILLRNEAAYIFNYSDPRYTNTIADLITIILPYLLFVVANWCLTTLMDGKGKFKDIFIYTAYALIPVVITNLLSFGLSFVISYEEQIILTVLNAIGLIWFVILIFAGTVSTHDYSGKKTILTLFLTIIGMVIIVFIMMFFINIVQQVVDFVKIIYKDLSFR